MHLTFRKHKCRKKKNNSDNKGFKRLNTRLYEKKHMCTLHYQIMHSWKKKLIQIKKIPKNKEPKKGFSIKNIKKKIKCNFTVVPFLIR
jgi:hypothetical protein